MFKKILGLFFMMCLVFGMSVTVVASDFEREASLETWTQNRMQDRARQMGYDSVEQYVEQWGEMEVVELVVVPMNPQDVLELFDIDVTSRTLSEEDVELLESVIEAELSGEMIYIAKVYVGISYYLTADGEEVLADVVYSADYIVAPRNTFNFMQLRITAQLRSNGVTWRVENTSPSFAAHVDAQADLVDRNFNRIDIQRVQRQLSVSGGPAREVSLSLWGNWLGSGIDVIMNRNHQSPAFIVWNSI